MKNQRFTTVENIAARIATTHKNKNLIIDEIAQWCAECSIEIVGNPDAMYKYNKVKCFVTSAKALLPCNIYRLLDVYDNLDNRKTLYYNDGIHLIFNSNEYFDKDANGYEYVYINYYGIAVDNKTGYPLIPRGHELACEAYCVWKLYTEDYLTGKINGQQWGYLDQQKTIQCAAANNGFRHDSNDDMKGILNVVHNMIPNAKAIPLFHLDGVE